jgi:subtilase family serine protease
MGAFRAVAFVLGCSLIASLAQAQEISQVGAPVNDAVRVTLAGNVRPEARNLEYDRGPVPDSFRMNGLQLLLRRPHAQQAALDRFVEDQQNRRSPRYHKWLTAAQFGSQFGPSSRDIAAIADWLGTQGFHVEGVSVGRTLIDFSGDAGHVKTAFHTEIHNLNVNGALHIANMSDPQIPAALAPAVIGIVSLSDFRPHPMHKRAKYTTSSGCGGPCYGMVPGDLAKIYNLTPLFNAGVAGKGETIVVVEDTNVFDTSDWTKFRSKFGLSGFESGGFTQVHPSGSASCHSPGVNGDDSEAILDAEWASAAAPDATIELASCKNESSGFGGYTALVNLVNSGTPPPVVSISYGDCEADDGAAQNAAFKNIYEQAASEGMSIFVAAGDENAAECDSDEKYATHGIAASGWASTIYNVAVGGTDFSDTYAGTNSTYWSSSNTSAYGSAKSYVPEIPWNDSCASELLAKFYSGSKVTYGSSGFCNTSAGKWYLGTDGGGGAPSACATGHASTNDVVSGTCAGYAKPSWQKGFLGMPGNGVRNLPDVSLFAADGVWSHFYIYCDSDPSDGSCSGSPKNWPGAGGTSFSSPIMAGIQALVDEENGPQGNPDAIYYALAAAEYGISGTSKCNSSKGNGVSSSCIFYDVTAGDMDVNCRGSHDCYDPSGKNGVLSTSNSSYKPAYAAGTGWDFATGIGTVNAANLVKNWP